MAGSRVPRQGGRTRRCRFSHTHRPHLQHVPRDVLLAAVTADAELGVIVRLAVGQPVPATSQQSGRAPQDPTLARERGCGRGTSHFLLLPVTGPPSGTTPAPRETARTVPFQGGRNEVQSAGATCPAQRQREGLAAPPEVHSGPIRRQAVPVAVVLVTSDAPSGHCPWVSGQPGAGRLTTEPPRRGAWGKGPGAHGREITQARRWVQHLPTRELISFLFLNFRGKEGEQVGTSMMRGKP